MRTRRRSRHDALDQSGQGHAARKPGDHKGRPYSGEDAASVCIPEFMLYIIDIWHEVVVMERAKIFWSGRSQAVRLPKDFRFPGEEVRIRRHGSAVILEPVAEDWAWLDSIAGKLDEDFVEAVRESVVEQERPALEKLFR